MDLRTALRLKRVCNPPYRFQVGPRVYEYDPLLNTTVIVDRKPKADQDWRKEADGWHNRLEHKS